VCHNIGGNDLSHFADVGGSNERIAVDHHFSYAEFGNADFRSKPLSEQSDLELLRSADRARLSRDSGPAALAHGIDRQSVFPLVGHRLPHQFTSEWQRSSDGSHNRAE